MSHNLLSKKRQQFHSKIRSQYIQGYINKVRYQLHQQQMTASLHVLNNLIELTNQSITKDQLRQLVRYANEGNENNAIIHIGNLMIDGIVTMDDVRQCGGELVLGESRYWVWLVKVIFNTHSESHTNSNNNNNLSYYSQWQSKAIFYVMGKFVTSQLAFALIQSLQIIKHLLSLCHQFTNNSFINYLFTSYNGVLIKLKDCCLYSDKRVSELSYQLLDQIISLGDQHTVQLIKICSLIEIQRVMILGFNKLDCGQKRFPLIICRMVNNIYASGVRLSETMLRAVINRGLNAGNSQRVRLQFSYLWLSFCETCAVGMLEVAIEWRMLDVLEELMMGSGENKSSSKHAQTISKNVDAILRAILEKTRFMNQQKSLQISTTIHLMFRQYGLTIQYMNYKQTPNSNNSLQAIYQPQPLPPTQSRMDIQ